MCLDLLNEDYGWGCCLMVERQTGDQVTGLNPSRRIFFSRVKFLCQFLFQFLIQPRVTAVACKADKSIHKSAQV